MSEEQPPEESKATKYFIVAACIVFVLILGGLLLWGKLVKPPAEPELNTLDYNYFEFVEIGGLWNTDIDLGGTLYEATFRYNPEQVEDVYITGTLTNYNKAPVYITFDPDADEDAFKYLALATTELSLHMVRALNISIEAACTKNETDACIDRPIVTCDDPDKTVVYLQAEPPTQITLGDGCVTLSGEGLDLLKSVDRMLYQWYKIMEYKPE